MSGTHRVTDSSPPSSPTILSSGSGPSKSQLLSFSDPRRGPNFAASESDSFNGSSAFFGSRSGYIDPQQLSGRHNWSYSSENKVCCAYSRQPKRRHDRLWTDISVHHIQTTRSDIDQLQFQIANASPETLQMFKNPAYMRAIEDLRVARVEIERLTGLNSVWECVTKFFYFPLSLTLVLPTGKPTPSS